MVSKLTLGMVFLLAGCVTAMGQKGIDRLTTCPNTDWTTVKQNLLRAGYQLRTETEQQLVTDFKIADDGYGGGRKSRKIVVTKDADGTIRFKDRLKTVRERDGILMGSGMGRRPGLSVGVGIQVGDEIEDEFDQEYYEERRSDYEAVQSEVCG
jgi:hypothetical protein